MNSQASVFIDANTFIYFLDETAQQHGSTITALQKLVDKQTELYTSHHVIEEVLFIVAKLATAQAVTIAIERIAELPGLLLVEPDTDLTFARRYVKLWQKSKVGINDALLLQLMIDANIRHLFSYDETFAKQAIKFGITSIDVQ